MSRVIVCGARNYRDWDHVQRVLDEVLVEDDIVVTGGAKGADYLANSYATLNDMELEVYPADWDNYGRGAGPIRNKYMAGLDDVRLVVAFPGGRGTASMVEIAEEYGIPVLEVGDGEWHEHAYDIRVTDKAWQCACGALGASMGSTS